MWMPLASLEPEHQRFGIDPPQCFLCSSFFFEAESGAHTVAYDDGQTITGPLGDPEGEFPIFCRE